MVKSLLLFFKTICYMNSRFFFTGLITFLLSSCGGQVEPPEKTASQPVSAPSICGDEMTADLYLQNVSVAMDAAVKKRTEEKFASIIDSQRIIQAVEQGDLRFNNAEAKVQTNNGTNTVVCQAQLSFRLPENAQSEAQTFAPVLGITKYEDYLKKIAEENNLKYNNNTWTQNINFRLIEQDGKVSLSTNETALSNLSNALAGAILPYGIKEIFEMDERVFSRQEVLHKTLNPAPNATIMQSASEAETSASPVISLLNEEKPTAEIASATVSPQELEQAKQKFHNAQSRLNQRWRTLDETVRSSLSAEENNWENSMNSRCAQGTEVAQLSCKANMIEDRVKYLQGFAID